MSSLTPTNSARLGEILTPSLLRQIVNLRLPWPRQGALDFAAVGTFYMQVPPASVMEELSAVVFPALQALSLVDLAEFPSPLKFLPDISSSDFVEEALGLQLLLDQCPRALLRGADQRWIYAFFDIISFRFAQELFALPNGLWIGNKDRWVGELGYSFDFWTIARLFTMMPFAHSESLEWQTTLLDMTEEVRVEIEKLTGLRDLFRDQKTELMQDTAAWVRLTTRELPNWEEAKLETYSFFSYAFMEAVLPITKKYGRQPHRNAAMGRKSTPEEVEFLRRTVHFTQVNEEAAKQIEDDVGANRWTPLTNRPQGA